MMKLCAWSPGTSLSDQTIIIAQIGLYIMEPPEGRGYSKLKNLYAREVPDPKVQNLILYFSNFIDRNGTNYMCVLFPPTRTKLTPSLFVPQNKQKYKVIATFCHCKVHVI